MGEKLKKLREDAGWSQSELARRSGLSQGHVRDIETGRVKKNIGYQTLEALARAFAFTVTELLEALDRGTVAPEATASIPTC